MKNPACGQVQVRKVKARLRMLQHSERVSGNVSQTCRFFGVSRALFYIWKQRFEKDGLAGLRDQPRRPHRIRFRIPPEIVSLILRIREERRRVADPPREEMVLGAAALCAFTSKGCGSFP